MVHVLQHTTCILMQQYAEQLQVLLFRVAMASLDKDTTLKIQDLLKQYFEGVDENSHNTSSYLKIFQHGSFL